MTVHVYIPDCINFCYISSVMQKVLNWLHKPGYIEVQHLQYLDHCTIVHRDLTRAQPKGKGAFIV